MIKNTSNKKYNTQRINTQTLIDISNNNNNNNNKDKDRYKDRYKDKNIHKDGSSLELRKTKYIQINKT